MARNARNNIKGRYFHVMVQGIDKEYVFPDDGCKGYYLTCLQRGKEKSPVKLLAFCVMGNHAHILVTVKQVSDLSAYFKHVNALYANYYNRIRHRSGYVFRGRFRSQLIADTNQLCACLAYIHNNPVKAGIVARAEDYGYSSYTNYLRERGIIDFDTAKKYFDASPAGIAHIMQDCTQGDWLEHETPSFEDKEAVLSELMQRYGIQAFKNTNTDTLAKITIEMHARCGASIKEMAQTFGVGRESLRKRVVANTVP